MEPQLLRKVQLTQLEIAREIKRVCEENGITYFLSDGSLLGAVRHQGFIPWDDDMDMAMPRADYERFCRIAPEKLKKEYCFQNWYTDPNYGLPFGKVLKRNTVCLESKKSHRLKENGFYVDIFPIDSMPEDPKAQMTYWRRLLDIYRVKLMKCGYQPWMENDKILWKKRIGYLYYQLRALFTTGEKLSKAYDALATAPKKGKWVCLQWGGQAKPVPFRREWISDLGSYTFEGVTFPGPKEYDKYLTAQYGAYMVFPPEHERGNRHQFAEIDFGE